MANCAYEERRDYCEDTLVFVNSPGTGESIAQNQAHREREQWIRRINICEIYS